MDARTSQRSRHGSARPMATGQTAANTALDHRDCILTNPSRSPLSSSSLLSPPLSLFRHGCSCPLLRRYWHRQPPQPGETVRRLRPETVCSQTDCIRTCRGTRLSPSAGRTSPLWLSVSTCPSRAAIVFSPSPCMELATSTAGCSCHAVFPLPINGPCSTRSSSSRRLDIRSTPEALLDMSRRVAACA